ncbi:MAG: homing endonuclease associated repeat-containing protein [Hyphomicrobium sp.]
MRKFALKLRKRNNAADELLADLRNAAEKLSAKSITVAAYNEVGQYSSTTMLRRFGTWNKALAAAGLKINNRLNIPDEELFENLATVWTALGRQPVGSDIGKSAGLSQFSLGTYEKRFGTWNNSLTEFIRYIEQPDNSSQQMQSFASTKTGTSRRTLRKINWRLRAIVLIRDNCICGMCGASPAKNSDVTLHVDHILAWSRGGETEITNLRTLCSICNVGKSDL